MSGGSQKTISGVVASFNRDELEADVARKAQALGLGYFDARSREFQPDMLSFISVEEAQKGVLPVKKDRKNFTLGVTDPKSEQAQATIAELSHYYTVEPVLVSWESIKDALPHFRGLKKQILEKRNDYEIETSTEPLTFKDLETQLNEAPLQDILKYIVTMGLSTEASDIHLEPQKEGARVRFRIDGVLHVVGLLNDERYKYILSQIELSSGLKLNVNEAQEGRLEVKKTGGNISVRVETMPTLYGDDISLRIFNTEATMLNLSDLGLNEYHKVPLAKSLARPNGMILVVGPTGAGKSSTIYAVLNALNKTEVKIVTLEDPIEYALPGIAQSQINEGESFVERLKAVLREDPDIVMVGEIRDAETADVALHAALTGHVMISTFHANNAVTAIGLLKEIATAKTLLGTSINLIIAQRLVRRLCQSCKKLYTPKPQELEFAQKVWDELPAEIKKDQKLEFFASSGCETCGQLGYKGRIGIFELLDLNIELQKLIGSENITSSEMQDAARKSGMITMEEDGLLKAVNGTTSLSEVMKAVKE